jgi:hypothetical protein
MPGTATIFASQSTQVAVASMVDELAAGARSANARFGFLTCTVDVEVEALRTGLAQALPGVAFVGATSCRSVIGSGQLLRGPHAAAALWLCGDVRCSVAARASPADEALGRSLARQALDGLGPGRAARFAILQATPGTEEPLLRGLALELGDVPLLGGSAADDDISGGWSIFTREARYPAGAAVVVVDWPGKVATPYLSGAMPTELQGVVTKVSGRVIHEIDGKPAADVYNAWLGGALDQALREGGVILGQTTLTPLGVVRSFGITLVHPERIVLPEKAISTFAEVAKGERVTLVRSTKLGMQGRPANLVARAMSEAGIAPAELKGVLLFYCAGCMLAIDPATSAMVDSLRPVTGSAPVVGGFHFGEQGCPAPGRIVHGHRMTGAVLLA